MTDDHAWPQDWGTGLNEQVDWVDAGALAHLLDHPNLRGYVAEGLEFTYDSTNNILNIGDGKAFLHESATETNDHREDDGPAPKELLGALFAVQTGVSGDLTLVDGDTNYVYLALDQTVNETDADQGGSALEYHINTTQTAPPEPYLRVGRVDTFEQVAYEENRAPATTHNTLRITGE